MIRWLRKRDLREGINAHLSALDATLLRLEAEVEEHLTGHSKSPIPVSCFASASFESVRTAINLRQRILRAELRDLTGGWPWVKVTDNAWHHLMASPDFEGMSFGVAVYPSMNKVAGALLPGVN